MAPADESGADHLMNVLIDVLRAPFNALAAVTVVGGVCILGALNGLFRGRLLDAARAKRTAGRWVLGSSSVPVTIEGAEHVPAEGGFVLISNHESHFDGPLLVGHFPRDFTIVAKRELFLIPILGQGFRGFNFIEVDRANRGKSVANMDAATQHLQDGGGVLVFPEGHRTETGNLQDFKKGAFMQALKAQVPLIPAAIAGTRAILPSGSLYVRSRPVCLCIGPPISVAGKTVDDRDALMAEAQQTIAHLRAQAHARLQHDSSPTDP